MLNNKKTIKECELETGIKVKDTRWFSGKKNKKHNYTYTEKEFRKGIKRRRNKLCDREGIEIFI